MVGGCLKTGGVLSSIVCFPLTSAHVLHLTKLVQNDLDSNSRLGEDLERGREDILETFALGLESYPSR